MKCCNSGRFQNEHVYLQTVCRAQKPKPCKRKCEGDYFECSCAIPCGKLRLRCDKHCTNVCLDIDHHKRDK